MLLMFCAGLGGFPVGQKSVRFFPSEMYRQVKLRLRKIPLGQFPFGFIAGGVFSGRISGGILVHTCIKHKPCVSNLTNRNM